jgi:hypothetical protein
MDGVEDVMTRLGMALLGVALVATAARAQTLGEVGAAMAVHDAAAGAATSNMSALRSRAENAANAASAPNPVQLLSDYGKRVAAEQAGKSGGKDGWTRAGEMGGSHGGKAQSWETASAGHKGNAGNTPGWEKNDKRGTRAAPRKR